MPTNASTSLCIILIKLLRRRSSKHKKSSATRDKRFIGKSVKPEYLNLGLTNRHGLIAGATGTGKTVTLQILTEGLSKQGVPVFVADVKGDLSGLSQAGVPKSFLAERAEKIDFDDVADEPYNKTSRGGWLSMIQHYFFSEPKAVLMERSASPMMGNFTSILFSQ